MLGRGENENLLASDQLAISDYVEEFVFLEDGDLAEITPTSTTIWDEIDKQVNRQVVVAKALGETV